ncbi:MAG: cupin domain-containing protein [Acetobacteraceae bacterium]|nr:cupin domain-containing protein [Acetobacteraceae bacterium]MBV8520680.1 cupin domain-containing protein [Acetobacteraceae bacterium]
MPELVTERRNLLLAPLLAALPVASAKAAGVNPSMTIVVPPDKIPWKQLYDYPPESAETAPLFGDIAKPGQYFVMIRWHPGYMSAPHWYETDRLCVVVSGTWWVASGEDFAPESTVPAPAGSFVRRVARTPHYDGVRRGEKEPAVIAISGMGPITFHNAQPGTPGWRQL